MELLKLINSQLSVLEHSGDSAAAAEERDRIKALVDQLARRVFICLI